MFGWFTPKCPVDPAAKLWIENRLNWLSAEFGRDIFTRRSVIQPTEDFFPDPVDGTEESIRNLFDQVCRYMDVDPDNIELKIARQRDPMLFLDQSGNPISLNFGGQYQERSRRTLIELDLAELYDLEGAVGVMAHELAHYRLMGERRVYGDEFDNELLTDLAAVFHGFAIFRGNSPRNWHSMNKTWPGTNLARPEYMTTPMFGYAIAHTAWFRGEERPEWARFLSFDLRPYFKQSLRYLIKTGDSTFRPSRVS